MKPLKALFAPIALISSITCFDIISPKSAQANACPTSGSISGSEFVSRYGTGAPGDPDGSISGEGMCYGTPSRYQISIYEMGLCTSNPITTTDVANDTVDTSSCTTTTSGTWSGDLSGSASFDMDSGTRPDAGTYTHAYIFLSNEFGLKGDYALTDGASTTTTYYSNGAASGSTNVDSTTGSTYTASNYTESLTTFGGDGCEHAASDTFSTGSNPGVLTAVVTDDSKAVQTDCSSSGVSRIFGAFEPDTAFSVSDTVTGVEVTFTVTNKGMSVIGNGSGGVDQLGSGPFHAVFTFIE